MVGTIYKPPATPCPRGCLGCMRATWRWESHEDETFGQVSLLSLQFHKGSGIVEVA